MENTKKKNNNQLARRPRVGAAEGLQGVMEVTPYRPGPNYGRAAAPDCRKPFAPFTWIEKYPQKFEQQSNGVRRRVGASGGLQGMLVEQQVDGRGHINR